MKKTTIVILLFISQLALFGQSFNNLNVPMDHPRLFWDSTSLAIAKNWYVNNNFLIGAGYDSLTIYEGDEAMDYALKYVLSEGITDSNMRYVYARNAIEWAKIAFDVVQNVAFDTITFSGTCSPCRWYSENIILILDWCYPALQAQEWNYFYNGYNEVIPRWNSATWGNPTMVGNNFNHGYARQGILWSLMIYHENFTLADSFLNDAINSRWANFLNYASAKGIGGVPSEGTSYNYSILSYHLVSGKSMANAGYDYLNQTNFFKKAIAHTIYNTTPSPSYIGPNETNKYVLPYPYGDAGVFMSIDPWNEPLEGAHANFMLMMAYKYQGIGDLPLYAKNWVETHDRYSVFNGVPRYIRSVTDQLPTKSITNNPLDYFSPDGGGELPYGYSRNSWTDSTASSIFVQMGKPPYGGHEHQDAGSYTIQKGDRFLVIPPSGRGYGSGWQIPDYDGLPSSGVDVQRSIAKNTILFGKEGSAFYGETHGSIDRLQSHPEFFYAANDLTDTYKNPNNPNDPNSNNEHCESFVREFIYIKKLEVALIFDRTKSVITEDQTKTSLVHVQNQPIQTATDQYTVQNGDYEAIIHTLLPATKAIQVIDERIVTGRTPREDEAFRLQIENSDTGVVHFLNVIQAKGSAEVKATVNLIDTGNSYTVIVSDPVKGNAVVEFQKGQFSSGGRIGCHPTTIPTTLDPLNEQDQGITVTDDGPIWSTFPVGIDDFNEVETDPCDFAIYQSGNNLVLDVGKIEGNEIEVWISDISGKVVFEDKLYIDQTELFIDISQLNSTAIYFLNYNAKHCSSSMKWLKR